MTFVVEKFNTSTDPYNLANLGKLTFVGFREAFDISEDGEREAHATHIEVFSDKLNDVIGLKLPDGYQPEEVPFMSEIEVIGKASPFIYNFNRTVNQRNTDPYEVRSYGFALRVDGFKKAAAPKPDKAPENKG